MEKKQHIISTTKEIVEFVEALSIFVEHAKVTSVKHESGEFNFCVKVPVWYRILFGWWINMRIKKELTPRLPATIKFGFYLHS